jgi:hypothetical protein
MPTLTQAEIRENAISFVHEWKDEIRERAEAQTFWNEFLAIFGIKRRRVAVFEKAVKKTSGTTGAIDLFWKGVLLVEHKSRGQSLDKASLQAFDYLQNIDESDLPKFVLVSDFAQFRLYNLETNDEYHFSLTDLPSQTNLFGFISGWEKRIYKDQDPVNIQVAEKIGELHDELLASGYNGHKLEIFLVRLVYCLFADDTGVFPKDTFRFFIEERTNENGSDVGSMLQMLFQILDTPENIRQTTLDEDLQQFRYVNGALFSEIIPLPIFNRKMRETLLQACSFDWGKVSPAIFGSLFQSVMDKDKRRNLGAHYTSEKNILKLVQGLFLDDLYAEFAKYQQNLARLKQFHEKIASLKFFDPACGCGNFLVITYREMRRLELDVLKRIYALSNQTQVSFFDCKIDVDSFYGIEIEEFPQKIAEVALWLTDHLSNVLFSTEFGVIYDRLPLKKSPNIRHGDALQLDWHSLFSENSAALSDNLYILGNPPFIGKDKRTPQQNAGFDVACKDVQNYKTLDFVCAWHIKAAQFIQQTQIKVAFVSTNSITQGEQVGVLWQYLLERGIKIHFAHRTFKWSNEARGNAQVYCVIIGFGAFDVPNKRLFDYEKVTAEPHEIAVKNINPYLIDFEDYVISSRSKSICDVPEIVFGNMPNDGGNLLLNEEERLKLLAKEPNAENFIRKFLGAEEYINGKLRSCLWLKDALPSELRSMPLVLERIENVRKHRSASSRETTRKLADYPTLFGEIRQPNQSYVLVPSVSSEKRKFVPMGFMPKEVIASNLCLIIPNATLYLFGVLTSTMHMAWMRQVCGRLKSDYRYSNKLVYNNFPFPVNVSAKQTAKVEQAAQQVLDVRNNFPTQTLADLYDPNGMPKTLLDAHRKLDEAVEACYGNRKFKNDLERLAYLFELHRNYTEPLIKIEQAETKRSKRRK